MLHGYNGELISGYEIPCVHSELLIFMALLSNFLCSNSRKSGSRTLVGNSRLCYLTGRFGVFFQYIHVLIYILEKVTPKLKFKCRRIFQHEHGKIKSRKKIRILGKK